MTKRRRRRMKRKSRYIGEKRNRRKGGREGRGKGGMRSKNSVVNAFFSFDGKN